MILGFNVYLIHMHVSYISFTSLRALKELMYVFLGRISFIIIIMLRNLNFFQLFKLCFSFFWLLKAMYAGIVVLPLNITVNVINVAKNFKTFSSQMAHEITILYSSTILHTANVMHTL